MMVEHGALLFCTNVSTKVCVLFRISAIDFCIHLCYNIDTVKDRGVIKLQDLIKKLDQLERLLVKVDKLVYRLIQIAGTIGILILAIRSWFT